MKGGRRRRGGRRLGTMGEEGSERCREVRRVRGTSLLSL